MNKSDGRNIEYLRLLLNNLIAFQKDRIRVVVVSFEVYWSRVFKHWFYPVSISELAQDYNISRFFCLVFENNPIFSTSPHSSALYPPYCSLLKFRKLSIYFFQPQLIRILLSILCFRTVVLAFSWLTIFYVFITFLTTNSTLLWVLFWILSPFFIFFILSTFILYFIIFFFFIFFFFIFISSMYNFFPWFNGNWRIDFKIIVFELGWNWELTAEFEDKQTLTDCLVSGNQFSFKLRKLF